MTLVYRFVTRGSKAAIFAPGRLEKAEGCYFVVAQMSYADAVSQQEMAKTKDITVWVEVDGQGVAFMPVQRIRAKERKGAFVEIWALVHVPDAFEGQTKT